MQEIPDHSVDMILCDLPYGTTHCVWDIVIPFTPLWEQYKRVIQPNGRIVLTAGQPFTSLLVASNVKMFKHSLVWIKNTSANFQLASHQPMKMTEDIVVFAEGGFTYNAKIKCTYNPQMIKREKPIKQAKNGTRTSKLIELNPRPNPSLIKRDKINLEYKLPNNILVFNVDRERLHPTQKPVALFEYLVKTYTNEGDTVLDNCAGSGTTAIACLNTNRNYILIEKDLEYYRIAKKRIKEHQGGL